MENIQPSTRQVSTGIWIGATMAFQQRVAQREHLATEIAFLEGTVYGGGGGGWEVRRWIWCFFWWSMNCTSPEKQLTPPESKAGSFW